MIEVAERLIAERGVGGVSLREIGTQAGQRNTAAARYHFGSKEALVDAIFRHRMEPINARRLAMLDELDRAGRGHDLRGLVEAYVFPLAEMLGEPGRAGYYLRFCMKAGRVEGTSAAELGRDAWTRGVYIVRERLYGLLADLPREVRRDRWRFLASYIAHTLADREALLESGRTAALSSRQLFLGNLVDTAVAIARAPMSPFTRDAAAAHHGA
jgi:AcrR family transcriptional regulator